MKLIAFSGFARSGKDTAVSILVQEFGFTRLAFADKLRAFLYALNPMIVRDEDFPLPAWQSHIPEQIRLQEIIDEFGWDSYKSTVWGKEIRNLLQRLGTEAGRQVMGDTIWIDATLNNLDPDGKYAVSDARFINEFQAVKDRGGDIIRIEREGVGPVNDHPSELEALTWPHFDGMIHNDSDLVTFEHKIMSLGRKL